MPITPDGHWRSRTTAVRPLATFVLFTLAVVLTVLIVPPGPPLALALVILTALAAAVAFLVAYRRERAA